MILVKTALEGRRMLKLRSLLQEGLSLHFANILMLEEREGNLIVGWKYAPRAEDRDSVEQAWTIVNHDVKKHPGPISHFRVHIEGEHIDGPVKEL